MKNILSIDHQNPDNETVNRAAESLKADNLIVAPTETRYGLLGRADSHIVVEKLYNLKNRPKSMPTALFVKSIDDISKFAVLNEIALKLANKYLPGPLTLVLQADCELPSPIVVDNKIGIRYSSSPFIKMLLERFDFPVTATSANLYRADESDNIDEIFSFFGDKIDLYINVGELTNDVSTVVDLSENKIKLLRSGAITENEIMEII